ncbi:hypothetical protein [Frankia sp. AvcI1]|nr:hypothetical protein [Frankia sp. AvcI1]
MVERAIDELVDDFVAHPFRHRVEHSLLLQLFRALVAHIELDAPVRIGVSSFRTGLVHKEWPMPVVDGDRRGLFADVSTAVGGLLAMFSVVVPSAKAMRRHRRRRAPTAAGRIGGAWREPVDRLIETSVSAPSALTRCELADAARAAHSRARLSTRARRCLGWCRSSWPMWTGVAH